MKTYRKVFTLIIIVLALQTRFIDAKPSLDDYSSLPSISHVAMSSKGDLITFIKRADNTDTMLVYSLKEKKTLAALDVSAVKPSQLYFLDDEKIILKASEMTRLFNFRGEIDLSTAFIFNLKTKKFEQLLTPGDRIYPGQSGLGNITAISQDKKYVYMPAFIGEVNSGASPRYALMRVDLDSPNKPRTHKKGTGNTIDFFAGSDGEVLAIEEYNQKSNDHKVFAYNGKKKNLIFEEKTSYLTKSIVGLTSDKKSLVMLADSKARNRIDYFTMSLSDGKISETHWGRNDADVEGIIKNINNIVYGVRYSGFTPSYQFFDPSVQQRVEKVLAAFPEHAVYLRDWSHDWEKVLVYVEGSRNSGSYYLLDKENKATFLGGAYNVEPNEIHPIAKFKYKARDGLKIPTLLTIPYEKLSHLKNLPAIIYPHGGPESYDTIGFDGFAQAMANEGYLVIQPQFRGSDGFGSSHTRAGRGEWGKKMQDDLTDAVKALTKNGMIDPTKVCIVGSSYGGYAALAGGAFTPDLYKCVVSINGISDINKMLSHEKRDHGSSHSVVSYWEEVIAKGNIDRTALKNISPYYSAKNFKAPTLLIHGTKDDVVQIKQSQLMAKALKKSKKEVKLVELKKETHYLENQTTRTQALKETISFLNKHLK